MTLFFRAIDAGEPIVIYGDGSASRDYTHVEDICCALQLALEADVAGGTVLHIASGIETTVTELAELCRNAAGVPDHPIEHLPKRPGEVERNFATYDLANKLLGYAPSIKREDGIARTWEWFAEHVFTQG
jgi:UDP-glucose 4-epimerase